MDTFVKSEIEAGVGRITLSRPDKRNALKRDFIVQLIEALDELADDQALRVLILQAEGSVFCAGMDLGEMQERAESKFRKREWQKDSKLYAELLLKLYQIAVPTIAVMQGPALAGGVGLVLACDFVITADNAFVMLPEPARGITAAMVTPLLIHRIGAGPATHLLLCGQKMSAESCFDLGLAFSIAEVNELETQVKDLVKAIMGGSKSALGISKAHVQNCSLDVAAALKKSITVSAEARETEDAREGLAAFLEKRKPEWQIF